jgi:hypothetical protein
MIVGNTMKKITIDYTVLLRTDELYKSITLNRKEAMLKKVTRKFPIKRSLPNKLSILRFQGNFGLRRTKNLSVGYLMFLCQ